MEERVGISEASCVNEICFPAWLRRDVSLKLVPIATGAPERPTDATFSSRVVASNVNEKSRLFWCVRFARMKSV